MFGPSKILLGLAVFLCLLLSERLHAQEKALDGAWLNVGVGRNSLGFASGAASVSVRRGSGMLSARGTMNLQSFLGGNEWWDLGVLAGPATTSTKRFAAAGIGVAVAGGYQCEPCGFATGNQLPREARTIAVPMEVQLFLRGGERGGGGIGIYGFANLNPKGSFAGATVSLQLGKWR